MTGMEVLIQSAAKGTVLLIAGFAATALLRHKSAALRHTVWTACLAGSLALPPAILLLPRWGVIGSPAPQVSPVAVAAGTVTVTEVAAVPLAPPPISLPLAIWMAGAGTVAVWFLLGILRTSWMVRKAAGAPDETALAASVGIRRRVRVLIAGATPMPLTWGVLRPVVVLPGEEREWPAARRRAVLLHELIHVKRLDLLAQGIAQLASCLYWFHPLVWIAARRLRAEREQACDDAVLSLGIPAPEYAGYLMDLVRAAVVRRNAWRQAPAMAEASGLETRVRALLDRKRDRRPLDLRRTAAIAATGVALLAPLAAMSESVPVSAPPPPAPTQTVAPELQEPPAPPKPTPAKIFHGPALHRVLLAEQAPSTPQVGRGSLVGTVRDPSGAVIPNCTIVLHNLEGFNQETTQSGSNGQYRMDYIPAGHYSIQVTAPGFATFGRHDVRVTAGDVGLINVNMALGTISATVTVSGKKPATVTPNVATAPGRIKVGGNVQQPHLVRQVRPVYPPELQQLGVEGTVSLQAIISKDGVPMSLRALSSSTDPRLIPLAMDAVSQWLYSPALLNGEPVETVTTIDVTFTLDQ